MTTITIELPTGGVRHFSKVVFVWLCHTVTGWKTNLPQYVYGDDLNAVYALGGEQHEANSFAWYIAGGQIHRDQATHITPVEAGNQFRNTYGDRLIIALNMKPDYPTVEMWVPNMVLPPETFGLPTFVGETTEDFESYCASAIEHLTQHAGWVVPVKR